jgi:hypothetical protein
MKFLIILLLLVPQCLHVKAQQGKIHHFNSHQLELDSLVKGLDLDINSLEEYVQQNQELPAEKIFLHLDRPFYLQGDTIWFKAYLWYGYDQIPDTISGVLYVDLISPQGRLLHKNKLLIQNGTSQGDFCLDSNVTPGNYHIRAYTRLMYETGLGEPFEQPITINPAQQYFHFECIPVIQKQSDNDSLQISLRFFEIDPSGTLNWSYNHDISYSLRIGDTILQKGVIPMENTKEHTLKYSLANPYARDSLADLQISIQDDRVSYENQFHIPLQENIDLQFFPEGGKLINGLESKVAFKAIGPDGLGRGVTGEIKTADDTLVTGFSSAHKGMGTFMLTPESNQQYFAHLWYNNRKHIIPLPIASEEGVVISVTYPGDYYNPYVSIKQRPGGLIEPKYIVGSAYGNIWFSATVKAFKDSTRLKIPIYLLPEGICRLTILNADFQPECERLIYVDKDQGFEIEVTPDSSTYKPRSKVTLLIKASDIAWAPVQTELSIAVVDGEQIGQNAKPGIKAYKLLGSELQGYIEDADTYFENGSWANISLLDLLLMTHGYRKFIPSVQNDGVLNYNSEQNLKITGRLEYKGRKPSKKKLDYTKIGLILLCSSEDYYVEKSFPDSLGYFEFQVPHIHGISRFVLQAATAKKKPFKGDIIIDDPIPTPHILKPIIKKEPIASTTEEYVLQTQEARKTERSKPLLPDSIAWSLSLEEVEVTAKAKDWYRRYEHDARRIIDLDTLDPNGNKYEDLYDLLVKEFGAKWKTVGFIRTVLLPCNKTTKLPDQKIITYFPPIYVIDGKIYWNGEGFNFMPLQALAGYPVNEIKRILVMPPMHTGVAYYAADEIYGYPLFISQSMVVIESYSKNTYRGNAQGIKTFLREGLNAPREFYSPRYEGPLRNSKVYDSRATLFWNPSILTDVNGETKVEFYTSDRQTNLEIIVNGINVDNGFSGEARSQIEVFDN